MRNKYPKTIPIRNPRIIEVVGNELTLGAGRTSTETAENLILEAIEARKIRRALEQAAASNNSTVAA